LQQSLDLSAQEFHGCSVFVAIGSCTVHLTVKTDHCIAPSEVLQMN